MDIKKAKQLRIVGFLLVAVGFYQVTMFFFIVKMNFILEQDLFGVVIRVILWVALLAVFKFKFWRIGLAFHICSNIVMRFTRFADVQSDVVYVMLAVISYLFLIPAAYYFNKLKEIK